MDLQLVFAGLAGAIAQFVDGALGMGFGVSSASLLAYLGFAPAVVSVSVHVAKIASGIASGVAHIRFGNVDRRTALILAGAGSAGGAVGATALLTVAATLAKPVVALILLALGVRVFIKFHRRAAVSPERGVTGASRADSPTEATVPTLKLVALGMVGGTIDAMGGGGWGPVCTPSLASDDRIGPRVAIGSVNVAEVAVAVSVVAVIGVGTAGAGIPWAVVGTLIAGGVVIAPIAAWACSRMPIAPLGMAVGALLVALNTRTLLAGLPRQAIRLDLAVQDLWIPVGLALGVAVLMRWRKTRTRPAHTETRATSDIEATPARGVRAR